MTEQVLKYSEECPFCGYEDVEAFVADYDFFCKGCRSWYDVRTAERLGRVFEAI